MTTESRLRNGILTLDGKQFATQTYNVRIVPSHKEEGDSLEMLDGSSLTPDATTSWQLEAKHIQDFTDQAGLQAFSWASAGETVAYTWQPTGATGPSYTGNVTVRELEHGGDVGKRLEVDLSWPLTGKPTVTYPGP